MKESNLTFSEGFLGVQAKVAREKGNQILAFNWDEAAKIIKEQFAKHSDLSAEAGLQGDWNHTGGVIFENGRPVNSEYTYLASNWAKPTLILNWDGQEQTEIECSVVEHGSRFAAGTKWDKESLAILEIELENP